MDIEWRGSPEVINKIATVEIVLAIQHVIYAPNFLVFVINGG